MRTLLTIAILLLAQTALWAGEVELKSLDSAESTQKKYGPYVGVFGGQTTSTTAGLSLDYVGHSLGYDVADQNGNLLVGFEVGYSWRTKRFLEFGLEFEGFFSSTEIDAVISNTGNEGAPITLSDVATANADMNYVAFMLNGIVTLDLRKLKPRIGGWIPRLRPYFGGGIGGAQLWFRNQAIQSVGDVLAVPTASSISPFSLDEFVFAYQLFGGLEFKINDKIALYGEYRRITFEKVSDLDNLETEAVLGGIHIRY